MFSRQEIEDAILNLQNGIAVGESNNIIMKWCENPDSIREAIDIITTSDNERIIIATCPIAQDNILHHWMKYSISDRSAIRNHIEELLVNYSGSDIARSQIIRLIVSIALKDWPDEWPSCVHDFIHSASSSQEMCILDMKILSELIVTIHETPTITNYTRLRLIEEFDKSSNEIMQMIDLSLGNIDFDSICVPTIRLLKELCLTAPYSVLEQYMGNMLPALFNSFATNYQCSDDTMITLSNLLINRSDARDVATSLFTETLPILGNFCTGEEPIPDYMLLFIMNYFTVYGPDIDELCFEGEDMIDETSELVKAIYTTIANNPPIEEHCEEYWALWRSVLYRYSRSANSKNPFEALKPCLQLFRPLIPLIRESLFHSFASATEAGRLKSVNSQACWIFITSADKSGMIDFLQSQQPSPSLCYAIGLVDACLSGREERDMIFKIFPTLYQFNQASKDIEFGVSLLYAVSHAIRFMNREFTFLVAFGNCLRNFILSEDAIVRSAAVNALFYISMRQPRLLLLAEKVFVEQEAVENEDGTETEEKSRIKIVEDDQAEESIIYGIYDILFRVSNWGVKNSAKILKSVALVASSRQDEESRNRIYEYISNAILSLVQNDDPNVIKDSLLVINSLTTLKLNEGSIIFIPIYNPLTVLLQASIESNNDEQVSDTIDAITSTLLVDMNPTVMANIENFSEIILQLPQFRESALLAFSRLRSKYNVMESLFEQIYEALIKDIIFNLADEEVSTDAFSVLRLMRTFNIRKGLVSLLLEITVYFIKDERLNVAKEALKVFRKIVEFLCDEQEGGTQNQETEDGEKIDLMSIVEPRKHFIDTTFSALTDTFHKPIFKQIAKAIQALYRAMSVASIVVSPDQFDNDVNEVLSAIIPNYTPPNPDFLIVFSRALRSHTGDFVQFSSDLKEFLVTTNCASPSDKNLFKKELKLDSLEQELMNLVAAEEKNAIVAEELDILQDLKNLKIENDEQLELLPELKNFTI